MNFAFPALLVSVLILPGLILRYTYARGAWGWASPTSMRRIADELAYGIIFAILLHTIWLTLSKTLGLDPDVRSALMLLVGNFGDKSNQLDLALSSVADHELSVSGYFLSLYACAATAGALGHRVVRKLHLDHHTRLFRFDNYWYYMLTGEVLAFVENQPEGRAVDGVYLSAVINQGVSSYLYRGIVYDFTYDRDGGLDTIVLTDAHRRSLAADRDDDSAAGKAVSDASQLRSPDERYYEIHGDFFVLRYSEIRTLNLDYFSVTLETESST
jgi:hypothetical protein